VRLRLSAPPARIDDALCGFAPPPPHCCARDAWCVPPCLSDSQSCLWDHACHAGDELLSLCESLSSHSLQGCTPQEVRGQGLALRVLCLLLRRHCLLFL
jgi:hypothetical protein